MHTVVFVMQTSVLIEGTVADKKKLAIAQESKALGDFFFFFFFSGFGIDLHRDRGFAP